LLFQVPPYGLRIANLDPGSLRSFLERRFRKIAKKSVVKAWEAGRA